MSIVNLKLEEEIRLLKSFAISVLGDGKNEYKESFVKEVLESVKEEVIGEFSGKQDFLKVLEK